MHFTTSGKGLLRLMLRKMLLIMKWTAFLLLTVILHVCSPGLSQQVTITGKNLSLEQVFAE